MGLSRSSQLCRSRQRQTKLAAIGRAHEQVRRATTLRAVERQFAQTRQLPKEHRTRVVDVVGGAMAAAQMTKLDCLQGARLHARCWLATSAAILTLHARGRRHVPAHDACATWLAGRLGLSPTNNVLVGARAIAQRAQQRRGGEHARTAGPGTARVARLNVPQLRRGPCKVARLHTVRVKVVEGHIKHPRVAGAHVSVLGFAEVRCE